MENQINTRLYSTQGLQRLAIFGATRGVGKQALNLALEAGHQVSVLARNPARLEISHSHLTVHTGDATNLDDVRRTVKGAHAVISALGAPAMSNSKVRSVGTAYVVRAMEEEGITRLLSVSLLGAGESRAALPFFLRYVFFPFYLRRAAADHEVQEEIIRNSALEWTVVRPPHLTAGPVTGTYAHGFKNDLSGLTLKVSRADVADLILREVAEPRYLKRTVGLSNVA